MNDAITPGQINNEISTHTSDETRLAAAAERKRLKSAKAHVDATIGFYLHLAAYVLVIGGLVALDWRDGGSWWSQWPAFGWGLGLAGHAIGIWGRFPALITRWRLRKIHSLVARRA